MEKNMKRTNLLRFVVFGAVGFGIGGAIAGWFADDFLLIPFGPLLLPLGLLAIGALGGTSLGMAFEGWREVAVIALLGTTGYVCGLIVAAIVWLFVVVLEGPNRSGFSSFYIEYGFLGAVTGAVEGAALSLAFGDRRSVFALTLAGFVGFGFGDMFGLPSTCYASSLRCCRAIRCLGGA